MREITLPINAAIDQLPHSLIQRSGGLFYSGPRAFEKKCPLYILGLNPGGSPTEMANATIQQHISQWRSISQPWSEYVDVSWQNKEPGTYGLQPRMKHLFANLGIDLRAVPASNCVFVRSIDETALAAEKARLFEQCWPVHDAVIRSLGVHTILCLGGTAGKWVRKAIGADRLLDRFVERNKRGWASEAHVAADGRAVVTLTHPGRANWRNPVADPSELVRAVLDRRHHALSA